MMKPFKYGQNPHESVSCSGMPPLTMHPDSALSLNAFLDIACGYAIAGARADQLVYCKHAAPIFSLQLQGEDWEGRLDQWIALNRGRDFGTFVYNGTLTAELVERLAGMRFHTVAAPSASDGSIAMLADGVVQTANRGVVLVTGRVEPRHDQLVRLSSGDQQIEYRTTLPSGVDFSSFMERVVRELRTLAAAVFIDEDLVTVGCGYFDPLQLLEVTLSPFEDQAAKITVATDACFSVKDPTRLLHQAGVSELHLFGAKQEHIELTSMLRAAGIAAHLHEHRAFRY